MGQNSITMFGNDSGAAGGPIAFVQDAFLDVSNTPSNNTGFSSSLAKNPLTNLFGNDDFPRFGPKTLWIKDIQLEPDRSKWVNGEQTFRIIWNESFPSAQGYTFGAVELFQNGKQFGIRVRTPNDGVGVGGVFRKVMFITAPVTGTGSGTIKVDGVANATTADWSLLPLQEPQTNNGYNAISHAATNETYDIHDYQIVANQGMQLVVVGIVVYSEHPSLVIDQLPGSTYNNKTKSTTTAGVTIALPSFGASTGGNAVIYKAQSANYNMSTLGVSTLVTGGVGMISTTTINLTTGTGASFLAGYGVIGSWGPATGLSQYVGVIQSMSTDAATVYPQLGLGISGPLYRSFIGGQSLSINASFHMLAYSFGASEMWSMVGSSTTYLDPQGRYAVWGQNIGQTLIDGVWPAIGFSGGNGFFQVEGYFSAAEIEWVGMSAASLHGTMAINGLPVYNHNNIGFTGTLKKSVFSDAGPGWNQFTFFSGLSQINSGVLRVNMYRRRWDQSASFGLLGNFDTLQAFVKTPVGATGVAPGTYRRVFADQLPFKGMSWIRSTGATWPGGVAYTTSGITSSLTFQYYGRHCAILGLAAGCSLNMSLDGSPITTQINQVITAATYGFHTVGMSFFPTGGGTAVISAIDYFRDYGEMNSLQTFAQLSPASPAPTKTNRPLTVRGFTASSTYLTPYGVAYLRVKMCGAGGGGGGSGTTQNSGNDGTDTTFGPHTCTHGVAAAAANTPGNGGTGIIGAGGIGLSVAGGPGSGGMENVTVNSCTLAGGPGGSNPFGGAGGGGVGGAAGGNASAFTGAGGGGAGCGVNAVAFAGGGGGAGGFLDIVIPNPLASYSVSVGGGGAGGAAGTNGFTGGFGAAGYILVEEWYGQ